MRVRLLIRDETRFVELPMVPRVGEIIESAAFGKCEVVNVIYTPDSPDHPVTLVLVFELAMFDKSSREQQIIFHWGRSISRRPRTPLAVDYAQTA